jgi:Beta-propeller repeat
MQTPSPRISTAAFVAAALALVLSFLFITNRTLNKTNSKPAAQPKLESAKSVATIPASVKQEWLKAYGKLPLSFEANQGQGPAQAQFLSRGEGFNLSLTAQEADFTLRQSAPQQRVNTDRSKLRSRLSATRGTEKLSVLRMRLEGSNPAAAGIGEERTATKVNYFIGNDPKKWHTEVRAYAKVKYSSVYPGIDLVFYGNQREMEYDFVVAPNADPKAIALKIDGANKIHLDSSGNLIMNIAGGAVQLKKPDVHQESNGIRREVAGNYTIANNHEVQFALANYDRTQPLTIDPVVTYATYVGGSGNAGNGDSATGIALDSSGDAYIAGVTFSADLTLVNAIGTAPASVTGGNSTAFVAELNPTGTAALYLTYLGGSTADGADAIAVDSSGSNIYVTGFTESADFPVSATPFKGNPGPGSVSQSGSAFVTRLSPALAGAAQLVYSSYLGGSGIEDEGHGIAIDGSGDAFITGETFSTDFPTMNPIQAALASSASNAFLTEINTGATTGPTSLVFSTFLGGTGAGNGNFPFGDIALGIALDSSSNAYIVGTTSSQDFPTQGTTVSPCTKNNDSEAFLSEISLGTPASATLVYSTCLGGTTADLGNAIGLGPNNLVYLTGATFSADFPVTTNTIPLGFPGPPPAGFPNALDSVAFVSTVNTTTGALGYSTLLGGNGGDVGFGIAADSSGVAYVTGQTGSTDFPITPGAIQQTRTNAAGNAFVSKVNASAGGKGGTDLLYSTYFGGTGDPTNPIFPDPDSGNAIAVSGTNAYITGQVTTGLTTTAGAYQAATHNATGINAFVAELPLVSTLSVTPTSINFGSQLVTVPSTPAQVVTLTNNSSASISIPFTVIGANAADFVATASGATPCGASLAAGAMCTIGVIFTPSVAAAESASLQIADGAGLPILVALTGTGSATADFSLTVPATANLTSGLAGSIPIMVNGIGGLTDPVTLSCTAGTMNVSSCTVSPTSVAPGGMATASVTATISFVAPPATIKTPPPASIRQVVFLILGMCTLFMIPMTQRFRTRMGMAAAMLVFIAVAGCSGSPSSHTTSGSVTITGMGTGAAAGITHSATVNLAISK